MEPRKKTRVLCVDDDEFILAHLRVVLEVEHEVVAARDGQEGLEILAQGGIDWVVLDYQLPDMNGGHFLLTAHRRGFRPRYVLLSSHKLGPLDQMGLHPIGVRASLQKPLIPRQLRTLLAIGPEGEAAEPEPAVLSR